MYFVGVSVPQTNALIAKECAKGKDLTFVDITSVTLDSSGQIRSGIFLADGLHLNRKGYELWRDVLRPTMMKKELKYEKGKDAADAGGNRARQGAHVKTGSPSPPGDPDVLPYRVDTAETQFHQRGRSEPASLTPAPDREPRKANESRAQRQQQEQGNRGPHQAE